MSRTCGLCLASVPGFVKSHVIPEAISVEGLRDGEFMAIASSGAGSRPQRSWTGVYSRIVCDQCERSFHACDDYLINFLRQRASGKRAHWDGRDYTAIVFNGWDPQKICRAFLQILFRAHLSDHAMYRRVDLGAHAECIRRALHDSSDCSRYPVVLRYIAEPLANVLVNPFRERIDGVMTYRMYVPNFTATIKVDKRPFAEPFRSVQLNDMRGNVVAIHAAKLSPSERRVVHSLHAANAPALEKMFNGVRRD